VRRLVEAERHDLYGILPALEGQRPAWQVATQPGGRRSFGRNEQLAGTGPGGKASGRVHRIPESGQLNVCPSPTAPNQTRPV
jgi:hypothetical protein